MKSAKIIWIDTLHFFIKYWFLELLGFDQTNDISELEGLFDHSGNTTDPVQVPPTLEHEHFCVLHLSIIS